MNHIRQQLTRSTNFMHVVASGVMPGSAESAQRTGAIFPNLLFLYQKTVNISRKNWFTKSFKGRQKKWRHFFLFFETLSFVKRHLDVGRHLSLTTLRHWLWRVSYHHNVCSVYNFVIVECYKSS